MFMAHVSIVSYRPKKKIIESILLLRQFLWFLNIVEKHLTCRGSMKKIVFRGKLEQVIQRAISYGQSSDPHRPRRIFFQVDKTRSRAGPRHDDVMMCEFNLPRDFELQRYRGYIFLCLFVWLSGVKDG